MSAEYQDYGFPTSGPSHMHRHFTPAVINALPQSSQPLRILDIGCGNGYLCGQLLGLGHQVVGVDLSEEGITTARQAHSTGRFELLGATDRILDDLREEPFDVIVSTEVIEHLYAPRSFVDGCLKALRPGGKLILTTPYHGYLKNLALSVFNKWDAHASPLWDGGHIKLWSRATLTALLKERGFQAFGFQGVGRLPWLWMTMVVTAEKPKA